MQTVKGTQRQVVVLQIGKSRYFEEAFFVVRREVRQTRANGSEMLIEANRILRESTRAEEKRRHPRAVRLIWFAVGLAIGLGIAAAAVFLRHAT